VRPIAGVGVHLDRFERAHPVGAGAPAGQPFAADVGELVVPPGGVRLELLDDLVRDCVLEVVGGDAARSIARHAKSLVDVLALGARAECGGACAGDLDHLVDQRAAVILPLTQPCP
jgi:hypothetical protein